MKEKHAERLKTIAKIGIPLLGALTVKYAYENEKAIGFMYHTEYGNFWVGRFKGRERKIIQYSGHESDDSLELQDPPMQKLTRRDIRAFKKVISALREQVAPNDSSE